MPGGRPCKQIDRKLFEQLCGIQCTKQEICAALDVTDKTLENWCKREYGAGFSDVFRLKRGIGKISLRRSQFELAKKNANMAIWLGKNYLEQSDSPEIVDPEALRRAREILEGVESAID